MSDRISMERSESPWTDFHGSETYPTVTSDVIMLLITFDCWTQLHQEVTSYQTYPSSCFSPCSSRTVATYIEERRFLELFRQAVQDALQKQHDLNVIARAPVTSKLMQDHL